MKKTETQVASHQELTNLAKRCSDFINQFQTWRNPDLEINLKDVAFLTESLADYKELVKDAAQLNIVDLTRMPRGWWPGFDAQISDQRHLVASKPTQRIGNGTGQDWVKGETYNIPPTSLPDFFKSATGMLVNRALNTVRNDELTHGPLVTHDSPGGPKGFTIHIS
jgi:hypothetical protein